MRADWTHGSDSWTAQGDIYDAEQNVLGMSNISFSGANVLGRWEHTTDTSRLMVQAYYDHTEREAPSDGAPFDFDTYDVEIQHSFAIGSSHQIVWGAGKRLHDYDVENVGGLQFRPPHRTLDLANVFAQDIVAVSDRVNLTVGLKLEDNPYSGWSALPDIRLSWSASDAAMLWAAASRAIRSPTPFDADVAEVVGGVPFLVGNPDFQNEKVTAYEIGYRGLPTDWLSLSVSGFYDEYDDLRTVEITPVTLAAADVGQSAEGRDLWSRGLGRRAGRAVVAPVAGISLAAQGSAIQGGCDRPARCRAGRQRSALARVSEVVDGLARRHHVRRLRSLRRRAARPAHDAYFELSLRVAWDVSPSWEISLSGFNLMHERHVEYAPPTGAQIERSFFIEARWRN